ncbi:MAG: glycoside hydrolase family 16 protein [Granulosicoccaceae bacterium]
MNKITALSCIAVLTFTLSACSSDNSNAPAVGNDGNEATQNDANNITGNPGTDTTGDTVTTNTDTDTTNTDTTNTNTSSPDTNNSDYVVPPGNDVSGGDNDSPTLTETLSLQGPFIKDISRSAGPPSVPQGLTALLVGADWVEFSWRPSVDDQSVEAYEVYRDNSLVYTIRGDSGDPDYRSWITTTHMDCDYTRNASCRNNRPAPGSSINLTVVAIDNEGMRSAASAPLNIKLVTPSSSSVDLSNYSSVFTEEFEEGVLDRNKWKTALPWNNDVINGESQFLVNIFGNSPPAYDPFVLNGSTLAITAISTPSDLLAQANNQPYLSGVITSADHFEMTYGYVEMNAKLARGDAILSAFYLFNQDFDNNKPEIDIIEYNGSHPNIANQTYHYFDSNRTRWASGEGHSSPTMETNTDNLSNNYHTYSVLWEKELMIWYIDDVEVRRVTGPRVSDEPMNIIAQLVMGSTWVGTPSAASAVMEIDYIRAWQRN